MSEVADKLKDILENGVTEIRDAMSQQRINASGKSAAGIKVEIKETDLAVIGTITAPPGVVYTDKGRGPSRGRSSEGGFDMEKAKEWARDKGLPTWFRESGKAMTKDEQAFLIMRKVHRDGFYGTNSQGKEYLEPILAEVTKEINDTIRDPLLDLVKNKLNYGVNPKRAA